MDNTYLSKIKSRGYWRINLRPTSIAEKISLPQCLNYVESSRVSLRGWDYPHISSRNDDTTGSENHGEFIEHWIDWWSHVEFWRMYRSTQFLHYRALKEDWEDWDERRASERPPQGGISVLGIIWQWTEVFEFAFRLARAGIYSNGATLTISLENANNRQLWVSESNRMPFSYERRTSAKRIQHEIDLSPTILINSDHNFYVPKLIDFFEHFNWTPGASLVQADQQKLLTRSF